MAAAAIDRLLDAGTDPGSAPLAMDKGRPLYRTDSGSAPAMDKGRPLYRYHSDAAALTHPRSPSPSSSPYIVASNARGRWFEKNQNPATSTASNFRDPGPSDQRVAQELSTAAWRKSPTTTTTGTGTVASPASKNGFHESGDAVGKFLNDKQEIVMEGKQASEQKQQAQLADGEHKRPLPSPGFRKSLASSGYGEEFFDAFESPFEGSSDESSSQAGDTGEAEVTSVRNSASDEQPEHVEILRTSAEALEIVLQKLAAGGLAVPSTLNGISQVREQVADLDIAGQLYIKRFVEAAVARGAARAEIEEQLEAELEIKNSEIENKSREVTRLRDKVRYNELVSREMSHRNQEAVEMARKKRRMRQRVTRVAAIALGAGVSVALIYKFAPRQWTTWKLNRNAVDSASSTVNSSEASQS